MKTFFTSIKTKFTLLVICFFCVLKSSGNVIITAPSVVVPACSFPTLSYTLGDIVITEGNKADFGTGNNQTLILTAPANFQFTAVASVSYATGKNITAISGTFSSSVITITYSVNNTNRSDVMTISGIEVRAILASTTVNITRTVLNPGTGTIAGVTNGVTSFGSMSTSFATLGGTYLVGTGQTYTTITAAVNAYNTGCLSSAVTFLLKDATYGSETFPITINDNPGSSSVNTLTIKPNVSTTVTITGSNATALFRLNGADYVTIDGSNSSGGTTRNLTITNTNAGTSSTVIWLNSTAASDAAANNTIKNCIVNGNASTTTYAGILSSGSTLTNPGTTAEAANINNTYRNNLVTTAAIGIGCFGPTGNESGTVISGNNIGSAIAANKIGLSGIEIHEQSGCLISSNTISGITTSTVLVASGIALFGEQSNDTLRLNTINNITNTSVNSGFGWGCNGINLSSTTTSSNTLVYNNFISDISGYGYLPRAHTDDNGYGIVVDDGGGYNIYHNTVVINTNQTVSGLPAAFNITDNVSASSSINLKDNIFGNIQTQSGNHYAIISGVAKTVFNSIDYNDYYVASGPIGYLSTDRITLANVVTGFGGNANSINVTPVYTSSTDFHINASNAGNISNLNNKGTAIAALTSDYDVQTRNGLTPDIGADEWLKPNTTAWVGLTSATWSTASNWECNTIPTSITDMTVTGGYAFMPTVTASQAVKDINLSSPGVITITGGPLQVYGDINYTGGSFSASAGMIEFKRTGTAQSISGSWFSGRNLSGLINSNSTGVSISATANDTLRILSFVSFGSVTNSTITTGNNLILVSRDTATASVGQIVSGSGNAITGNAIVERYVSSGRQWRFLSVPTTTAQTINQAWQEGNAAGGNTRAGYGLYITGNTYPAGGFDAYTATPTIKTLVSGVWAGIANTSSQTIASNAGYMCYIRGSRSSTGANATLSATVLRTTGPLKQGDQAGIAVPASAFASIGNPYASAVDMRNITSTGVQNFFYVWDPKLSSGSAYGLGAYQLFSKSGANYVVTPGGGSYGASGSINNYIQSGSAFLVKGVGGGGTLTFKENAKATGSSMVYRVQDIPQSSLRANLYMFNPETTAPVLMDGVFVEYGANYADEVNDDDATKMTNTSENVGMRRSNKLLSIERRHAIHTTDSIYLNLTGVRVQGYQWEINLLHLDFSGEVFLLDNYLNTKTTLRNHDINRVRFNIINVPGSYAADRFTIIFKNSEIARSGSVTNEQHVAAVNNTAQVKNNSTAKTIIAEHASDIKVYPNPVQNKILHINFTNQADGNYDLKLVNQLGQVVYSNAVQLTGDNSVISLQLGKTLAPGNYQLNITTAGGIKNSQQIIIE